MLDIRYLRENTDEVRQRLSLRDPSLSARVDEVLELDLQRRQSETRLQQLQGERKTLSKTVGGLRAAGKDSSEIEARVKSLANEMEELASAASEFDARQRDLLLRIPNLPHPAIPPGSDASANVVLRDYLAETRKMQGEDHLSIATRLGLLDFERAAKISGSGFACFTGRGARLQRALVQFMLDLHTTAHAYTEVAPPYLIRRDCMIGTGQLPKFEEDMYGLEEGALFLAPTAEVPVTNLRREEILRADELPVRLTAYSPCFRREAGATGRDNRGIIRLHQFDKVELVKICHPDQAEAELESLTADAEQVLKLLALPYRVIELCAGDLGFSAGRTYDIEVWSPGQQTWLEVSSCSHFGDYQARRMGLRFKDGEGKNRFCHTLNGSGTALPRLFVALLENHCQPDGSIAIPPPLQQAFGTDSIAA
jgi:seryl-tRNA synthetase